MDNKKQCISQQLISANSSIPEGCITYVLIEMIGPSQLYQVEMSSSFRVFGFCLFYF